MHFNGWPTHWDEWIELDSDRIQPFRARTVQTVGTVVRSPVPASPVQGAMDCDTVLTLIQGGLRYIEFLQRLVARSGVLSTEEAQEFCEEHVAAVDRIGRFMSDLAHALSGSHSVREVNLVRTVSH